MRINSINAYKNTYPRTTKETKTAPAFGAWDAGSIVRAKKSIQENKMCHITLLFRNIDFWPKFSKYVEQKFPNGTKLFNYAASDGSESYTIIMKLIDDMGEEKAKRYFPIDTCDISASAIKQMKKREIELSMHEEEGFFVNLKNKGINDYFDVKNEKKLHSWDRDILLVKDNLYSNIVPKRADIMKDLDDSSKFQDPCVLLFRNAWYFFSKKGQNDLAQKLFDKLKPGSSLIIGSVDRPQIPPILIKKGFKPVKLYGEEQSYIFERP